MFWECSPCWACHVGVDHVLTWFKNMLTMMTAAWMFWLCSPTQVSIKNRCRAKCASRGQGQTMRGGKSDPDFFFLLTTNSGCQAACRSPKLGVAEFGQCIFKHVPNAAKHCQCRKLQRWTFQEWGIVALNWEPIKGASAWQVALFDMPNSYRFDILSILIFSEISLSISISISIFS